MATRTNMGASNMQMVPDGKRPAQAAVKAGTVKSGVVNGTHLLNSHAPGKLGHNRSTSLRPRKK